MAAEQFFEGTTQAGRTLALFYEVVDYDVLIDVDGEPFTNPTEQSFTGTLDGEPLTVEQLRWNSETTTVVSDRGTFTATTTTGSAEDHSEALRSFLEHRPSDGWQVEVVSREVVSDEWRFTLSVTNGHLHERVEVRMPEKVARTYGGGDLPTDEQVAASMAEDWRSKKWSDFQKMAERPHTILMRLR